MEVLRTGVSALSAFDPDDPDNSREAEIRKAMRLTAQMPTLVAAWERIRRGKAPIAPNPKLNLAANFLYMMSGKKPTPLATKTFDVALILHADHEFNASTFAARVTAATLSDIHSAVVSGIGALKGPLHGGANEQVLHMITEIGHRNNIPAFIEGVKSGKGQRLMGFGHRVYKSYDPRAKIVKRLAHEVFEQVGMDKDLDIALELERIALSDDYFISRKLYPNVDFYTGLVYRSMGFPPDFFTVLFAVARTAGWLAQWEEMLLDPEQKIARPRQIYVGASERAYKSQLTTKAPASRKASARR
jgi:citrate synthase